MSRVTYYDSRLPTKIFSASAPSKKGVDQERHGMFGTPEYTSWAAMNSRCYNPNTIGWHIYWNVEVYEPWRKSFKSFYRHMGPKPSPAHTLDRIDSKRGYEPGNVRWATSVTQNQNRGMQSRNTSGFRGVSRLGNKWAANASRNNRHLYLGCFSDKEDAALAYDCAAIQLYGDDAKTNIINQESL